MSKLLRVTLKEFLISLREAQSYHAFRKEPIPLAKPDEYNQIDNCLIIPFQKFSGKSLYPGIHKKAAMMFYLLIKNHPLSNGNKRMAILAVNWFYSKNRYTLRFSKNKRVLRIFTSQDLARTYIFKLAMDTVNSDSKDKDRVVDIIERVFMKYAHCDYSH